MLLLIVGGRTDHIVRTNPITLLTVRIVLGGGGSGFNGVLSEFSGRIRYANRVRAKGFSNG